MWEKEREGVGERGEEGEKSVAVNECHLSSAPGGQQLCRHRALDFPPNETLRESCGRREGREQAVEVNHRNAPGCSELPGQVEKGGVSRWLWVLPCSVLHTIGSAPVRASSSSPLLSPSP